MSDDVVQRHDHLDGRVEDHEQRLTVVVVLGGDRLDPRHVLARQRGDQRGAVGEVAVERGLTDAGVAPDLVHRHVAPGAQKLARGREDRGAAALGVLAQRGLVDRSARSEDTAAGADLRQNGHSCPYNVSGEHDRGRRRDPIRDVILAVLSLGAVAYALVGAVVIPALPTIQHDLHTTETGVTWVLTAYLLAASVGTSILGRLGDIHGKEHILLWALLILGVGTLIAALSQSLPMLIVGRALQGAAGGIFPLAFGIVRDEFPRERVAGSIGLLSAILGVGSGLGIVGSGLIVKYLNWHWLFWIPLALTVIAAFFTWRFIPESPVRAPGKINWAAATLMTISMSAILLAISETTTWGWGSPKTLGLLAAGIAVGACWVARRGAQRNAARST